MLHQSLQQSLLQSLHPRSRLWRHQRRRLQQSLTQAPVQHLPRPGLTTGGSMPTDLPLWRAARLRGRRLR